MEEAEGLGISHILGQICADSSPPRPAVMAYDMPPFESIIGGGISGVVYALNDSFVLKAATGFNYSQWDLSVERKIYERLRSSGSQQILKGHFRRDPRGLVLERLSCPLRTHLRHLHGQRQRASDDDLVKWADQLINGLWHMHSKDVLQGNIGCHNLLLYNSTEHSAGDLKFCDFGGASIDGGQVTVKYEPPNRHPKIRGPNLTTELFALGSTLYEMSTTEVPLPEGPQKDFPDCEHLILGDIIDACWRDCYDSTLDVAIEMQIIRYEHRVRKNIAHLWPELRPCMTPGTYS